MAIKGHGGGHSRFSCVPLSVRRTKKMKRITLSLLCLTALSFSAFAEENSSSPAADNSGRNERDRSGETKTSFDQSNSKADIDVTAAIRRAVMKDDSLSMTAKNVKIITENGMVTLRGPVKSAAEKAKIAELAAAAAGGAKIENQIEVKKSDKAEESEDESEKSEKSE